MNVEQARSPVQQVVLAMCMAGIAIAYVLTGHAPGWQAYLLSGLLAVGFMVASLAMWRGSRWLGLLAIFALLVAMFWEPGRPYSVASGVVLALLSAVSAYRRSRQTAEAVSTAPDEPPQTGDSSVP